MSYSDFEFKTAIYLASFTHLQIYASSKEKSPDYPIDCICSMDDEKFRDKILHPNKYTLLHDYIAWLHEDGIDYAIDKVDYNAVIDNILETLNYYNIKIRKIKTGEDEDDYHEYVVNKYKRLTPKIVNETFTILYNDKRLLLVFNEQISKFIISLKKNDYTKILKKNGVVLRCKYLPSWLKAAIFFRDKGRCQKCGKDLTNLLSSDRNLHYDHILSLDKGGTNDPTNFQLLCDKCNLSKNSRLSGVKNLNQEFWH